MKKIDLGKIIKDKNIDRKDLAEVLFPMHKHPVMAIDRVVDGLMLLDSTQITKLSDYTGMAIGNLFTDAWEPSIQGSLIFWINGKFRATLDTETWTTSISMDEVRGILRTYSTPGISLSDYVRKLDYELFKIINSDDKN